MQLSLDYIARNPNILRNIINLSSGEKLTFRPLLLTDMTSLTKFLQSLKPKTREYSTFPSYDQNTAQDLCDAINKYDKLRLVAESSDQKIVALFEFSFGIPESDRARFANYGIEISESDYSRFGLTIADDHQNQGLGSLVFPIISIIARQFSKTKIILYGGVLAENTRAIHFYKKHGFKQVGIFTNSDGVKSIDMVLDL